MRVRERVDEKLSERGESALSSVQRLIALYGD